VEDGVFILAFQCFRILYAQLLNQVQDSDVLIEVVTPGKMVHICHTQIVTQILTQIDDMLKYLCLHQIWKKIQNIDTFECAAYAIKYSKYVLHTNIPKKEFFN
jgi:hypothetical protein